MIDIDNFKKINDTYGHIFGNAILGTVGKYLKMPPKTADSLRAGEETSLYRYSEQRN
jgi:diguanylate cyclase (GGDEF)-like protein